MCELRVAHLFEIGDQAGTLWLPRQSFLRKRAVCGHAGADECTEPTEVRGCILISILNNFLR
jgi:hypothetical protein